MSDDVLTWTTTYRHSCERPGYGSAFERPDFFVHGDIAGFISIRTAEESYVDREGRVEKLFMTIDFDQFDEVFFGYVIELAAELTGIEEVSRPMSVKTPSL